MKTAKNNDRPVGKATPNAIEKYRSPRAILKTEAEKSVESFSPHHSQPDKRNKHLVLNQSAIKQAQNVLGTKTETETIEKALAQVIADDQRNRAAWAANEEFMSRMTEQNLEIIDVYGRLDCS